MKKKRCGLESCNKKLRITNTYECKCGLFFCRQHSFANEHNCSWDYKKEWEEKFKKENPVVQSLKVRKI